MSDYTRPYNEGWEDGKRFASAVFTAMLVVKDERVAELMQQVGRAEWTIRRMKERPDLDSMRQIAADYATHAAVEPSA